MSKNFTTNAIVKAKNITTLSEHVQADFKIIEASAYTSQAEHQAICESIKANLKRLGIISRQLADQGIADEKAEADAEQRQRKQLMESVVESSYRGIPVSIFRPFPI